MKRNLVCTLALAVGLAGASAVDAQVQILVGGGPSFPTGDFADITSAGFNVQAGARIGFPLLPVAARVDGLFNQWSADGLTDRVVGGTAAAELAFPGILFVPYFLAGPGIYHVSLDTGDGSATDTRAGFNAGLGARLGLMGLGVFAEARLHHVSLEGSSIQFIPVTLGVRF
jgi:hypothetical protein